MESHDWENRGLAEVRAVLAEAITAEWAYREDADATWLGGQQRGYDVISSEGKRDAKSVRIDTDGCVVLARRNAEPYDPERVDRLMLLHLDATTGYGVDFAGGTAKLAASARILAAWDVPVADLNRLLPEHGDDDPTWRNVRLDPADLAEYKVL